MASPFESPTHRQKRITFELSVFFVLCPGRKFVVLISSTLRGYVNRLCVQARSLSSYPHLAKASSQIFFNAPPYRLYVTIEPILEWFIARAFALRFFIMYRLYGFAIRVPYLSYYPYYPYRPHLTIFTVGVVIIWRNALSLH